MITVYIRVPDPVCGQLYFERQMDVRRAARMVRRAARLKSPHETWCFIGGRTYVWSPGLGLRAGLQET